MEQNTSRAANKMLELVAKLRQNTCGVCRAGPGPYGFGVYNAPLTKVGALITVTPDPYGDLPAPPETTEYAASVVGYCQSEQRRLSREELSSMGESSDRVTGLVISTLLELGKEPVMITREEYDEAFNVLANMEQQHGNGLTREEAIRLGDLNWWEERTPQEIVDFQLYEDLLCMPFHKFHEAVEAALGRPVWTHEFAVDGRLTGEYAAVKQAQAAGGPMPAVSLNDVYCCALRAMGGADEPSEPQPPDEGPRLTM